MELSRSEFRNEPTTVKYIESQAEHHQRISSEEEFKKFLAVHEIEE